MNSARPGTGSDERGPAILHQGFRPFFFLAIFQGLVMAPLWLAFYLGLWTYDGPFAALDWHIHEMLFGYGAAALAGFLLTAIPNWTGRTSVRGALLAILALIWIFGRLALLGVLGTAGWATLAIDCAFLAALCALALREIVASRSWRSLGVVAPVALFFVANLVFHLEVINVGAAVAGPRFGLSVIVFLIMLIGGRIIPSFTRNWLVKEGAKALPAKPGPFDALCLIAAALCLSLWTLWPSGLEARLALGLAAGLHLLRLARWRPFATTGNGLLAMLPLSYLFAPLGLFALALEQSTAAFHLLGIGAMGGMTLAVMIRATLGHTGRALESRPVFTIAYCCVALAALLRASAPYLGNLGLEFTMLSGSLWTIAFTLLLLRLAPMHWTYNAT